VNYKLAYAIGFHPWEDLADHPPFADKLLELVACEEDGYGPPYGAALDLGTGSAVWGVALAKRGWEVTGIDSYKGLRYRMPGLGREVLRRLGAIVVNLPGGEIVASLQSGAIDASEWIGPWNDMALGLHEAAKFYYYPGFNKPNGTGECIVALKTWNALDAELKAIVAHACAAEANYALAEMERLNAEALKALVGEHNVKLTAFPADLVAAARKEAGEVLGAVAARDAISGKVHRSYASFRGRTAPWSKVSIEAVLRARG